MAFKEISFIASRTVIMIRYKGKLIQFTSDKEEAFDEIKELLRVGLLTGDEQPIIQRISKETWTIEEFSKGLFGIDMENDRIIDIETQTEVGMELGRRMLEWAKDGFPFEPLLKFHRKVINNPSTESAKELYEFLERNMITITDDGNFIAYKKVKNIGEKGNMELRDCHTGKVKNNIGCIVEMPRKNVDDNRRNECSNGLHVCGWSYLSHFSGDVILTVEIEPQDVVSVPKDYNGAKMRVCRYKVLEVADAQERTDKYVKVVKKAIEHTPEEQEDNTSVVSGKIEATITKLDNGFANLTAQAVKNFIKENYGVDITTDNKNKQSIIKQANKIVLERDGS